MRVITGSARGRKLKTPENYDIRPTTDNVKESIFNIIQFELEGRRVLDLFGGTGQLGIEALSRGSAHCTFVEMRRDAVALMRENLKTVGFADCSKIVQGDALAFLSSCREKFDVILLDPPYHGELMDKAMEMANLIASKAQVAVRQAKQAIRIGTQIDMSSAIAFESEAFGLCFSTEDQKDAMQAFLNKEKMISYKNR